MKGGYSYSLWQILIDIKALPSTNSWGNSPGVRCAIANTAALTKIESGVGNLHGKWTNHEGLFGFNHDLCTRKSDA